MQPLVGEIRVFPFTLVPTGWALCNGQLLGVSRYPTLFRVIGTTYGGDGIGTFAVPDLQGATPLGVGQGQGLLPRALGDCGGSPSETLETSQLAPHSHLVRSSNSFGTQAAPGQNVWAKAGSARNQRMYSTSPGTGAQMNPGALAPTGGNQPHNNMPPYVSLCFCIALEGSDPSG